MKKYHKSTKREPWGLKQAGLSCILALLMCLSPALIAAAQSTDIAPANTEGQLFLNGKQLKNGDVVALTDQLIWQVPLAQEELSDGSTLLVLPEGLKQEPDQTAIVDDGTNQYPAEVQGDGHTLTVIFPSETLEQAIARSPSPTDSSSSVESSSSGDFSSAADLNADILAPTAHQTTFFNALVPSNEALTSASSIEPSLADSEPASSDASSQPAPDVPTAPAASEVVSSSVPDGNASNTPEGQDFMLLLPCIVDSTQVNPDDTIAVAGLRLRMDTDPLADDVLPNYSMSLIACKPDTNPKEPGDIVAANATISMHDLFFIRIHWNELAGVKVGTAYPLAALPVQIGTPASDGSDTFMTEVSGVDKPFAKLSWTAGNNILRVEFFDLGIVGGYDVLQKLTNVNLFFACSLDQDKLNADNQGKATITFPGGTSLSVIIKERVPQPPKMTKTVSNKDSVTGTATTNWDKYGIATWTVTYNHPTDAYVGDRPAKLVDQLPNGLELVPDSLNIKVNGTAESISSSLVDSNNKLTYPIPNNLLPDSEIVLTYQTRPTTAELSKIWHRPDTIAYSNRVQGLKADDQPISPALTATANLVLDKDWPGRSMITKTGEPITPINLAKPQVKWTIQVRTAGRSFAYLRVVDTMGKALTLDQSTVMVNGASISGSGTPSFAVSGADPTTMTVNLVQNDVADDLYTITYITDVDPRYYSQTVEIPQADLENTAKLVYAWPTGQGPSTIDLPPSITKLPGQAGLDNALVQKNAISYNAATHEMNWMVTVNPNKVDLTSAILVDDLNVGTNKHFFVPQTGAGLSEKKTAIQTAVENALNVAGLANNLLLASDLTEDKLTLAFGNIGTKSFTFPLTTYVADPAIWAGNVIDQEFLNTVTLQKAGTTVDSASCTGTTVASVPIAKDLSVTATQKYTSNVLKKEHTAYDPATHMLTWVLTVNENKTNLGNVNLEDVLPAGLSCVAADAKLDGNPFSGANTFTVDNSGPTPKVTVELKNVTAKQTVTFETTVDVNTTAFRDNKEISFENTAQIESTSNPDSVSSNKAIIKLENSVVDKKNNHTSGDRSVTYTVNLNPLGMNLLNNGSTQLELTDTLSDGLYLDISTVTLYDATRSVSKTDDNYKVNLTSGTPVPNPNVTYHASTNAFSIVIPDPKKSYVLTYKAYIVRSNVDLSNEVKLVGSVIPSSSSNYKGSSKFKMAAFGSASFQLPADSFFSVQIQKADSDGNKLTGAEFGLFSSKTSTTPLAKATCDSSTGIATLALPISELKGATKLYWKELTAPAGYALNDVWHTLDVATQNQELATLVNLKDLDATGAEIQIKKVDGASGTVLTGAEFTLYKNEACTELAVAATAVGSDGKLTFTGLYPNRPYWVKETKAPQGYRRLADPVELQATKSPVTVHTIANERSNVIEPPNANKPPNTNVTPPVSDSNHNDVKINDKRVPMRIPNYAAGRNEKASIQITIINPQNGQPLAGTHFSLYDKTKTTLLGSIVTDKFGRATFSGLKAGEYYIRETQVPKGYLVNDPWTMVTVLQDESLSIAMQYHPNPEGGSMSSDSSSASGGSGANANAYRKAGGLPVTGVSDSIAAWSIGIVISLMVTAGVCIVYVRKRPRK